MVQYYTHTAKQQKLPSGGKPEGRCAWNLGDRGPEKRENSKFPEGKVLQMLHHLFLHNYLYTLTMNFFCSHFFLDVCQLKSKRSAEVQIA